MSDFRKLDDKVYASPQITLEDVDTARALGVTMIVNNRPEGESEDQTPGPAIEAAAKAAGMDYIAIPISHGGFSHGQIAAMCEALGASAGPVLAYCRSGTRSTFLWSLALASQGSAPDALASSAAKAGYDLGPVRPMLDMLAAQAS